MMTGTTLAQVIPISVAPLLTRLYTPAEFGAFALFMALATLASIPATARYDMAIVLPESNEDAIDVLVLCLLLTAGLSLVSLLLVLACPQFIARMLEQSGVPSWLYWLPVMILTLGSTLALGSWLNRSREYRNLAVNSIVLHGATALSSIALGASRLTGQGLMLGRMLGQAAACVALAYHATRTLPLRRLRVRPKNLAAVARRYRQFPLYSVPYSFIAAFSREFPVIAFFSFGMPEAAGFFGLARNVMYLPMGFLSASLGQVFYREAAEQFGDPRLESLANDLVARIAALFTPPFVLLAFWAPDLFAFAFGERWREAGTYAALFAPAAYLYLFSGWADRIFVVAQKQQVSLYIQLSFDLALVAALIGTLTIGGTALYGVAVITAISVGYHLTYMYMVYRTAGFHLRALSAIAGKTFVTVCALSAGMLAARTLPADPVLQFAASVILALGAYAAWLGRRHTR
jgi:O-antigen/teichoic acid export membrane protein